MRFADDRRVAMTGIPGLVTAIETPPDGSANRRLSGMRALAQGDVEAFFQTDAVGSGTFWLFQHIPKTAGSSFRVELARRLRPDVNIRVDYLDDSRPHNDKLSDAVDAFLARIQLRPVRFASGHLHRDLVERIAQGNPHLRLLTMLRDPVDRVVSEYRYQCTPEHPPHREFMARYPSFEAYFSSPEARNNMHLFLRRSASDTAEQVIEALENQFMFVGVKEHYDLCCRILFALTGNRSAPTLYERRTLEHPHNQIPDLDRLIPQVRELNAADQLLYVHFRDLLDRNRAALEHYLDRTDP